MKETRHTRVDILWFHLRKVQIQAKLISAVLVSGSGNSQALSVWEQRDSSSDTGGCGVLGTQACLFYEVCNTYCTVNIWNFQCLHRLSDLNNRNSFSHNCADWKSKMKVSEVWLLLRPLSLAYRQPPSPFLTQPSSWTCTTLSVSLYIQVASSSLVAQLVKNLPAMQETQVRSLSREDLLEKEMATHSSILAWEIPWTEETIVHGIAESDMT